jgi:hypothetical protein
MNVARQNHSHSCVFAAEFVDGGNFCFVIHPEAHKSGGLKPPASCQTSMAEPLAHTAVCLAADPLVACFDENRSTWVAGHARLRVHLPDLQLGR